MATEKEGSEADGVKSRDSDRRGGGGRIILVLLLPGKGGGWANGSPARRQVGGDGGRGRSATAGGWLGQRDAGGARGRRRGPRM